MKSQAAEDDVEMEDAEMFEVHNVDDEEQDEEMNADLEEDAGSEIKSEKPSKKSSKAKTSGTAAVPAVGSSKGSGSKKDSKASKPPRDVPISLEKPKKPKVNKKEEAKNSKMESGFGVPIENKEESLKASYREASALADEKKKDYEHEVMLKAKARCL